MKNWIDIIKIVKSHEDSGLLIKSISKTVTKEIKERNGEFLGILVAKLGASFLSNVVENIFRGKVVISVVEGTVRQVKEQLEQVRELVLKYKNFVKMNLSRKEFI